jgi:hypothetical protein
VCRLATEEVIAKQRLESTLAHAQLAAKLKLLEVGDVTKQSRVRSRSSETPRAGETAEQRAERRARMQDGELSRKERLVAAAKSDKALTRLCVERTREQEFEQSAATVARVKAMEDAARRKKDIAAEAAASRRKREYTAKVDAEVAVQCTLQQKVRLKMISCCYAAIHCFLIYACFVC